MIEKRFENVLIAVTAKGAPCLIKGNKELVELMTEGDMFKNNCNPETIRQFPKDPGVYLCTITFWHKIGYDWDFVPSEIVALETSLMSVKLDR